MPNPFPGMNPYFENPLDWREVHAALIYCFRAALASALPSPFQARMEERVYIQEVSKEYVADDLVVERLAPQAGSDRQGSGMISSPPATTGEAVSPAVHPKDFDAPHHVAFNALAERERFIEIRTRRDNQAVVAVIEFLSPKNKTLGRGRNEYLRKQNDVINSNAHLLEIDLLRTGQYSLAPPEQELHERIGRFDYLVSLHYAEGGAEFDLWPLTLRDRLPRLCLPLINGESVIVDLQAVLERAYNDGNYDEILDYTKPPLPPLAPDDAKWANELIGKMQADSRTETDGIIEKKDL